MLTYPFTPTEMLGYMPAFADYVHDGRWYLYKHLLPIVDALEDVARGNCRRLAIFLPPRHCKSETVSKVFPSWRVCRDPKHRVIIAGYGKDFAAQWGLKTKNILSAYGGTFGVSLDPSSRAKDHWKTTEGGGVHCCGTGSAVTGLGCDTLIIDDPIRGFEQAHSPIERDTVWNWITADLFTRLEPGGSIVLINTRWHEDDVAGRLLAQARETGDEWRVIKMPAIAEQDEDWGEFKRAKGDPLCPERYPLDSLEDIKRRMGPYKWACLYQQDPTTPEGNFWPSHLFENVFVSSKPNHVEFPVIAIDPSLGRVKKDKVLGDYSAVVGLGYAPSQRHFYVDAVIDRMRPEQLTRAIAEVYHRFPVKPKRIGVEAHGFQSVLEQRFREDLPKYGVLCPIVPLQEHIQHSKELRIKELDGWITQRMIAVLDTPGGRMLVNQLKNFPLGHDDGPDALRMAFDVMTMEG